MPEPLLETAESGPEAEGLRFIPRVSLTEQVHSELARGLSTGQFLPGTRLGVRDLAAEMGLSPTPVREALQKLVAEGALSQEAGRSFRVPECTVEDYQDLRHLRLMLEGEAAALAARRITAAETEALAAIHDRLIEAKGREDYKSAIALNQAFHLGVCRHAGSARLLRIVEGLWLQMGPLLNMLYPRPPTQAISGTHFHIQLLDALREHDADAARAALQGDINGGSEDIVAAIAARRSQKKRKKN